LVFLCVLGGCIHPRSAYSSIDRYAFTRGTAYAAGWIDPPPDPPVTKLSQVAPGQRLVLSCGDFDRGIAFEAIVTPSAGPFEVLTLAKGRPSGASVDQLAFLAPLLEFPANRLASSSEMAAYEGEREELRGAIAGDPAGGLEKLARCPRALFPSDSAELLGQVIRHSKVTPGVLAAVVDMVAGRRETDAALRGWIGSGGAARILPGLLGEAACTREIAMRIATDAVSGLVRGDRELVVLAALRRDDLTSTDLLGLLKGVLTEVVSLSERRRETEGIVRHPAADAAVLAAAIALIDAVELSADRRQVLLAVLDAAAPRPAATEHVLLDAVRAAGARLDYDDDREQVLLAAAAHPAATDAVRSAIIASLGAFRSPEIRARVEAAARKR
jgi:hypothetical protein